MTIKNISEIINPDNEVLKPVKEQQQIYIPDIVNKNISRRNGMVYCLTGSGGSGKSSLLLNMFKSKTMYRGKFDNIYYFCPMSSFLSVVDHPFSEHEKVYHELTVPILESIYNELLAKKEAYIEYQEKKKIKMKLEKKKPKHYNKFDAGKAPQSNLRFDSYNEFESSDDDDEEVPELEYSCIIIDDFADALKEHDINMQLNRMIIKARHSMCSFIISLQIFFYLPKILRKQLNYITIFKPKAIPEWETISSELMNMNKDDALKVYNFVFDADYNHIDIDLANNTYYKNFNKLEIKS